MGYKDAEKQKEFGRLWRRKQNLKVKLSAVQILGGKCSVEDCGVTDFRCLHIDHKDVILRKKSGTQGGIQSSYQVVRGILTSETVQLLCANHHAIKTYEQDRLLYNNYY